MDEIIFQEFKGTGNTEIVLDRDLFNRRIFPCINIPQSGTRKEEKLYDPEELPKIVKLRRALGGRRQDPGDGARARPPLEVPDQRGLSEELLGLGTRADRGRCPRRLSLPGCLDRRV